MNEHNRYTSINNSNRVEYTWNKPIASSDLNEVQSIISSKLSALNGLTESGFQLSWQLIDTVTIQINNLFINTLPAAINYNNDTVNDNFQVSLPNLQVRVRATEYLTSAPRKFTLRVYYRIREVTSGDAIWRNGIRLSGLTVNSQPTITGNISSSIPNEIYDSNLNEAVSSRVLVEFTFVLDPPNKTIKPIKPIGSTEGDWKELVVKTLADSTPMSFDLDLSKQNYGLFGFVNLSGPRLFDYCKMTFPASFPTDKISYDQYAILLSSKTIFKKPANSSIWSSITGVVPSLFTKDSYIRVNKFIDGTSIYDENCANQAGYVIFDNALDSRIFLDYGSTSDSSSDSLIYTEYITSDTGEVTAIDHKILAPTFFSKDETSGGVYNDPDGHFLLCATLDNEIYFRNIFETA